MVRPLATALLLLICTCSTCAFGNSIGMNFTATRFGGGPYPILPNEVAGLVPQSNWNNSNPVANGSTSDISLPMAGVLVDNNGADTGAHVTWFNANAEVNSDGGNLTPNERLYRGLIEGSPFNSDPPQLTITVSDIPYAQYEVIAYLATFGFGATASAKLGDQEYFLVQSSNFTVDGFIQATSTNVADQKLATYAVFTGLTGSSFSLEVITQSGNRAGIAGFQIVEVPEPSSGVLLCVGTALGLWRTMRRRNG
jgi:hypothetical protein